MASNETLQTSTLTPEEAVVPPAIEEASRSIVRKVVEAPANMARLGSNAVKVMINGDTGALLSEAIGRHF